MILSKETESFLKKYENKKIVFTNGCFDILHRGHVSYLNHARSLGDALFVGLNSDSSVRKLKGPTRPINSELDRKCIDCVDIFSEETPLELIKLIRPLILVKGGDWTPDKIVGSQEVLSWGGKVLSLPFVDGFSTTGIVEKINQQ